MFFKINLKVPVNRNKSGIVHLTQVPITPAKHAMHKFSMLPQAINFNVLANASVI